VSETAPARGGRARGAAASAPPVAVAPELAAELRRSLGAAASLHPDAFVEEWIAQLRGRRDQRAEVVPLEAVRGWRMDREAGGLVHESGRFFSVIGLRVRRIEGEGELSWDQPIVEQPETGILGVAARRIRGVLHVCLQAKVEPGNIGGAQLSPTVQATYSNYSRFHGGRAPRFLELFLDPPPERVVFSRLQAEDGGRFLHKVNRNMLVLAGRALPLRLPERFIWVTLRQLARLVRRPNIVNACARSVFASLLGPVAGPPAGGGRRSAGRGAGRGLAATLQWLDDRRAGVHVQARRMALGELRDWGNDARGAFSHRHGRLFRVIGLRVSTRTREVASWCQPILESLSPGIVGLLVRRGPDGPEALLRAHAEPGDRGGALVGPTVQFAPGIYHGSGALPRPFLFDEFCFPGSFPVVHESFQAEEGARFYRESNLHRVLLLPAGRRLDHPPSHRWIPFAEARFLLHLGEQVNSGARSVFACLL